MVRLIGLVAVVPDNNSRNIACGCGILLILDDCLPPPAARYSLRLADTGVCVTLMPMLLLIMMHNVNRMLDIGVGCNVFVIVVMG